MKQQKMEIRYTEYSDERQLDVQSRALIAVAREASGNAYAPYSGFRVGAALALANDIIVIGNNQENAAYPSGLCAERVAMFSASANHPGIPFKAMAIYAEAEGYNLSGPVSPCGACRQVMAEYEKHFGKGFQLILADKKGKCLVFDKAEDILPFVFYESALKKT